MKKMFLFAAVALLSMAGCTKNEVNVVEDNAQITFLPVAHKAHTKALVDKTAYPESLPFGTYAYHDNGAGTLTKYIPNASVSIGDQVSYDAAGHFWSPATAYYWPATGTLNLFSYSPFKYQEEGGTNLDIVSCDGKVLKFTGYECRQHQSTDLLVATPVLGASANTHKIPGEWLKGVPTRFKHILCQLVEFQFQTVDEENNPKDYAHGHDNTPGKEYVDGDKVYIITEIKLTNVYGKGDYTFDTKGTLTTTDDVENWTNLQDKVNEVTWMTSGTKEFKGGKLTVGKSGDYSYALVIPQSCADIQVNISYQIKHYVDGDSFTEPVITKTTNLSTIHPDFVAGKKITYKVNIGGDNRIYWAPEVTDWVAEDGSFKI